MNGDNQANELGRKVRLIAMALLLSVFVVPVIMWWQAEEAGAQRPPVQKVAMSRFDLPAEPAVAVEPQDAPAAADPAAPATDTPSAPPAALAVTAIPAPPAVPARPAPPATPSVADRAPVGSALAPRATPHSAVSGASRATPARVDAPLDPFVPEPAPTGWQRPAPAPVVAVTSPIRVAAAPPSAPKPASAHPVIAAAPKAASPAAHAQDIPRSGAVKPAPAPVAQPLAEPAPAPPPTPLVDVRLRGIIRGTPDLALILVDGQTYFLKAGDPVTGAWVVADIKDNSVVLRSGDHVRELQIEGGSQT